MITGDLKSQIFKVWEAFWTGRLSNPINVIEQMTYLFFLRRLDELQTQKESTAIALEIAMLGTDGISPSRDD
jgi:type I restriction enzyme M protein